MTRRLFLKVWGTGLMLAALSCAIMGCGSGASEPDTPPPPVPEAHDEARITIVAMGDSLTEGYGVPEDAAYPALLEKRLNAAGHACRVINAGISGETSTGARSRLEWVLTLSPRIVILETGANDGLRGTDPDVTRENIAAIVTALRSRDIVVVLAGMKMVRNLGPDFTRRFDAIYPEIAAQQDVIFMPFFLEGVAGDPALNQTDGIHPNPAGYRVVVSHLMPYVVKALNRISP